MSLVACPECQKEISQYARWCPQCGHVRISSAPLRADVTDIEMGFGSMIVFMLKWSIAAIPALIILGVLVAFAAGLFAARHL